MMISISLLHNTCRILHSEYSKNPKRFFSISMGFFLSCSLTLNLGLSRKIDAKLILPSLILSFTVPHFAMHFFSKLSDEDRGDKTGSTDVKTPKPPKGSYAVDSDRKEELGDSSDTSESENSESITEPLEQLEELYKDPPKKNVTFSDALDQVYEYTPLTPEPSPPPSPKLARRNKPKRRPSNLGPALRVSANQEEIEE